MQLNARQLSLLQTAHCGNVLRARGRLLQCRSDGTENSAKTQQRLVDMLQLQITQEKVCSQLCILFTTARTAITHFRLQTYRSAVFQQLCRVRVQALCGFAFGILVQHCIERAPDTPCARVSVACRQPCTVMLVGYAGETVSS